MSQKSRILYLNKLHKIGISDIMLENILLV